MWRCNLIECLEYFSLYRQVFSYGFHDKCRCAECGKISGGPDPADDPLFAFSVEPFFIDVALQALIDRAEPAIQKLLTHIVHDHVVTCACSDLGNTITHRPCTHDTNQLARMLFAHYFDFSVQPLCSLCLCGDSFSNHSTTETQRTQRLHREEGIFNVRSPLRRRCRRRDTSKRSRALRRVVSTHTKYLSTNASLTVQSRGPTPLLHHSRSPVPDRVRVRVSPQLRPLKTLHSAPPDLLHSATIQSS